MRNKPVFVQYVYLRRCNNNPSYDRFTSLPASVQEQVWARMEKKGHRTPLRLVRKMQKVS